MKIPDAQEALDTAVNIVQAEERAYGWHAIIGKEPEVAKKIILRLLTENTLHQTFGGLCREDVKSMNPTEFLIVADDGFDDGAGYDHALYFFWPAALVKPGTPELNEDGEPYYDSGFWRFKGKHFAKHHIGQLEWSTVSALVGNTLHGSGACAIIGIGKITVAVEDVKDSKGVLVWRWPKVQVTDLAWLTGPEWEANRYSENGD